ncbi:hypothetical protein TrRE_jg670 [Triparma retinervis]|uniref:Tyrosine-protein kinase ephrin type A/B receptor-like domain-containing protein n=1 Tax=Triparma retinervis TaxID=2557542 RepID=A0A9W7AL32_9STRA|nr:hypothetical protein TrRE_jg670 [Triparma retinervis]
MRCVNDRSEIAQDVVGGERRKGWRWTFRKFPEESSFETQEPDVDFLDVGRSEKGHVRRHGVGRERDEGLSGGLHTLGREKFADKHSFSQRRSKTVSSEGRSDALFPFGIFGLFVMMVCAAGLLVAQGQVGKASGDGDDIYRNGGTITIHNTCPSPYSSNTPIQGSALDTSGTVNGNKYSYSGCYYFCDAGYYNQDGIGCQACQSGQAAPTGSLGADSCVDCSPGMYESSGVCSPCTGATYTSTSRETSCASCSGGTWAKTDHTGCTSDTTCAIGSGQATAGGICEVCPVGKYNGAEDDSQCITCPAGKFNPNTGSTAISDCGDCPVGRYSSVEYATVSECTACTSGKHNANTGAILASDCLDCAVGKYMETEAAEYCDFCPTGKINPSMTGSSSASVCSDCQAGDGPSNDSSVCVNCAAGKYGPSTSLTACNDCGRGKFNSIEGATSETQCSLCPIGKSSPPTGPPSTCESCQSGRYAPAEGYAQCAICDPGTACEEEAIEMESCSAGSFSGAGSGTCTKCGPTAIAPDPSTPSCLACNANQVANVARTECICQQGFYTGLVANEATPVPEGVSPHFPGMTLQNLNLLPEVAQWQLFFTLLGSLAIKVNMDDENLQDKYYFDAILTAVQFVPLVICIVVTANLKKNNPTNGNLESAIELGEIPNPVNMVRAAATSVVSALRSAENDFIKRSYEKEYRDKPRNETIKRDPQYEDPMPGPPPQKVKVNGGGGEAGSSKKLQPHITRVKSFKAEAQAGMARTRKAGSKK